MTADRQDLTLAEIRQRGADARRLTLPFFSNPFHREHGLPLEEWASRCQAWSAGWLHEDAGRDKGMRTVLRLRTW